MASKVKFNLKAFEEIRRLPKVRETLQGVVDRVASDALASGGDYGFGVEHGESRLRGYVVTADYAAIRAESKSNVLLRSLGNAEV